MEKMSRYKCPAYLAPVTRKQQRELLFIFLNQFHKIFKYIGCSSYTGIDPIAGFVQSLPRSSSLASQ
jgi:hypothetical protein